MSFNSFSNDTNKYFQSTYANEEDSGSSGESEGDEYGLPTELICSEGPNAIIPVLYFLIATIGLLGNFAVIYIITILKEYKKTVTNFYVLQLAVADFMFLFVLPFEAASLLDENRWIYGTAWCKITQSIRMLNYYASIMFLTMMSVDRYLAINHAMNSTAARYRSKRSVGVISTVVWMLGCLCVIYVMIKANTVNCECTLDFGSEEVNNVEIPSGYFETYEISSDEDFEFHISNLPGHCSYKGHHELSHWIITNFVIAFALPLCVITGCYILILRKISKPTIAGTKSQSSNKTRKRITYMVVALVTVFVVCWLPYYSFNLSRVNDNQLPKYSCEALQHITNILAYMNSALNPFFYLLMGANIKKRWDNVIKRTRSFRVSLTSRSDYMPGNGKRRRRKSSRMSYTGNFKSPDDDSISQSNVTKHSLIPSQSAFIKSEEDQV